MTLGPNEALIGADGFERELSTPALLLDLDAFEANLRDDGDAAAGAGRKLRPHVKAHKSTRDRAAPDRGRAVGLCCATVREAEVMAAAGSTASWSPRRWSRRAMVERLVAARERVADLAVVVDCEAGVDALAASPGPSGRSACSSTSTWASPDRRHRRRGRGPRGAAPGGATRPSLSRRPGLLRAPAARPDAGRAAGEGPRELGAAGRVPRRAAAAGLPAEIVSGGGTGTHHLDLEQGPFTEIQPGSYLFMDKQYGAVELAPGGPPFRTSLTIAARVVSTVQPDRVIVDAGFKAMATDAGPALVASGAPADAAYLFMGDEHGGLRFADGASRPALGALVTLVAPHCDPTVNLHDWLHVVRGGRLVDIWPIEARGY